MMRPLIILVCTINLFMAGCKTATKESACGSACGGCAAPCAGATEIQPEQTPEVPQTEPPKHEPMIETGYTQDALSPFIGTVRPFENVAPELEEIASPEAEESPVPEYGHGQRYEWLVGQLQRVHSPKHQWKMRYAPLDEHDEWGGSMILATDVRLDDWKDGDMVFVEGEILTERPSLYLAGPLYRVRSIRSAGEAAPIVRQIEN
jgi:hypothetical protein